jgi:pimeloyl-ACP methyl ester carboxylesterase
MKIARVLLPALLACSTLLGGHSTLASIEPTTMTGSLGGAEYEIQVPSTWNHTLVLFSHPYVVPGAPNPAADAISPTSGNWLLAHGYALAGSNYGATGWAAQQALQSDIVLLDFFGKTFGEPQRTIAWGASMGGMTSEALVEQFPTRFAAALPECSIDAGSVANWNTLLDTSFAFKVLLAPASALQLVRITKPAANLQLAEKLLAVAQSTAQGRARLALAAALGDIPGWYDPSTPEPAPTDYAAQEHNQFLLDQNLLVPFNLDLRVELEQRAGGNPSWTTGVDYTTQLTQSADQPEVMALYRQANLNLQADLQALQAATPIAADPAAVTYLRKYFDLTGRIQVPVLTLHTTGDGPAPVEHEQDYARVVDAAGNADLLRQVYVHRANHCTFTPAETIAAFQMLINRLDTGKWNVNPAAMNAVAASLGPAYNIPVYLYGPISVHAAPAFVPYQPATFLRPDDAIPPGE